MAFSFLHPRPRRPFLEVAHILSLAVPVGAGGAEDVGVDRFAQRVVEGAGGEIDVGLVDLGRQRRAAGLAAGDGVGGTKGVGLGVVLALQPAELGAGNNDDSLAAGAAGLATQ